MEIVSEKIEFKGNIIIGQSHFIKTVEDLFEAMSESGSAKFGIAFCEASGKCLIRHDGNDANLEKMAIDAANKLSCGHSFVIILENAFPISVLNKIKQTSEVCNVYCATANPLEVIIAKGENGRGILGVIDGCSPKGVETDSDKIERIELLKKFGYKR
jgi:hypothetical protein